LDIAVKGIGIIGTIVIICIVFYSIGRVNSFFEKILLRLGGAGFAREGAMD
jgi:hypothetical protein